MGLGDFFPDNIKEDFASRATENGSVLFMFVEEFNTNHSKYIIIISKDRTDVGFVVINTDVNFNVNYSSYLRNQHLRITPSDLSCLDHDSFIDCTDIKPIRNIEQLEALIKSDPDMVKGELNQELLNKIHETITFSRLVSNNKKRRFGFLSEAS